MASLTIQDGPEQPGRERQGMEFCIHAGARAHAESAGGGMPRLPGSESDW